MALLQGVIVFLLCEAISIKIAIGCLAYLLPQCLAFFLFVMFYLSRDSQKLRKTLRWAYFWMQISLLVEALWIPLSILRMDETEVSNASGALGDTLRDDKKGLAIGFLVVFLCFFVLASGFSYHYMRVLTKYAS